MAKDADLSIDRVNNETLEELTSRIWFQDSDVIINHRQSFDAVVVEGDVASNVSTSISTDFNSIFDAI